MINKTLAGTTGQILLGPGTFSQATGTFMAQEETDGDDPLNPKGREGTRIKDAGIPGSPQASGLFLSAHQLQAS